MGQKSSSPEEDINVMKLVWSGIHENPQYHANLFFLRLCRAHPHYSKYYTKHLHIPVKIDARTSLKFRLIIEAIGYLLIDFYKKPSQSEYVIGYIAMIHKDMGLTRTDMFTFGESLIKYLTLTFHQSMTSDHQKIVSRYINYILNEISNKIENLRKNEIIDSELGVSPKRTLKEQLFNTETLIYGHPRTWWIERKREWNERLELWKRGTDIINETEVSSTDEDDDASSREQFKDNLVNSGTWGSVEEFGKCYGIMKGRIKTIHHAQGRRRLTLVKNPGEDQYRAFETLIDVLYNSNAKEIHENSTNADSIARQRRRQRNSIS